jgi:Transcriptional regulator
MKNIEWDLYQQFLAVARGGGLTGGAETSGLSPATLGRRMLNLEQRLGSVLFERSQTGYRLTPEGQRLLAMLSDMEAAARQVETWRGDAGAGPLVRIACGTWNAWLIAENFGRLIGPRDDIRIEMTVAEQRAQLSHRENDIGLRAVEPEERNLAAQLVSEVAYAAYRARNAEATTGRWLAVTAEDAVSPYLRWPHQEHGTGIVATVTRARSLKDLAIAGAGMAVLPCFAGDLEPRLERVGGEIESLRHRQWIVMNVDDRHRREIRTVADRLRELLRGHRDLFEGRSPRP